MDEVERAQLQEAKADEEPVKRSAESSGQGQQWLDRPELKKTILEWFLWRQHEVREALQAVLGFEPSGSWCVLLTMGCIGRGRLRGAQSFPGMQPEIYAAHWISLI